MKNQNIDINCIYPYTKNNKIFKHLVSVQGFGYSGSGAVIDILREFDNTTTIATIEKESGLNDSHTTKINEITLYSRIPFNRFYKALQSEDDIEKDLWFKKILLKIGYFINGEGWEIGDKNIYNTEFLKLFNQFAKNILALPSSYIDNDNSCFIYPIYYDEIYENTPFAYATESNRPYIFYNFKKVNSKDYFKIVKNFLISFMKTIPSNDFLVLDQFLFLPTELRGYDLDFHKNFIGDIKQICVYRDPRDQYITIFDNDINSTNLTLQGFIEHINQIKPYFIPHPNRLMIRFEDLINDYENSITKVCDFLGIDKSHHINKGKYFIPEVSRKNIGIYKNYHDQRVMDKIKEGMSEYCYNS